MVPRVMSSRRRPYRSRSPGRVAPHGRPRIGAAAVLAAVAALTAGCGAGGSGARTGGGGGASKLEVVAAENFWGSIAAQLGGAKVRVQSIIVNPETDPHSYEPTPGTRARSRGARLAIVNGARLRRMGGEAAEGGSRRAGGWCWTSAICWARSRGKTPIAGTSRSTCGA